MNISSNTPSINSGQIALNASVKNIANPKAADIAKSVTDQIIGQNELESNVNAIKTQDQMLGSLLDIKA